MLRSLLIGLAALGTMAGVAAAQGKLDCGKAYKDVWERIDRERFRKDLARAAVRRQPHGLARL